MRMTTQLDIHENFNKLMTQQYIIIYKIQFNVCKLFLPSF